MSGQVLRNETIFDHCVSDKVRVDIWLLCHKCQHALNTISVSRELSRNIIFNRESTLRLFDKSVRISDPHSPRAPDATYDARYDLAKCYLIANGLLEGEHPNFGENLTEEERNALLAALIPGFEYRRDSSPGAHIKYSLVRSKELLEGLQETSSTFDVNATFHQATGLSLQDYQYLILSILSVSLSFTLKDVLDGEIFIDIQRFPDLVPLYEKLLQHTCISIDELALEMERTPSLSNEFLLLRKYPLMKIDEKPDYVC